MVRFVRSSSVVSRVISDETLIVPVRRGVGDLASIYSLNPVASAIWNAMSQPRTSSEIAEVIREQFDAAEDAISSDIHSFLSEMSAAGLATAVEAGAAA